MFHPLAAWSHLDQLAIGAATTVILSLSSIVIGCPLGLALYAGRSATRLGARLVAGYISFFRGTPLLVQLIVLFYVPPTLGIPLSPWQAAFLGLTFNTAAFQSEIYRGGFQSLPRGQSEAAIALGLARWPVYRLVLLPQVFRLTLPSLTNEAIDILKNSALVSVIAVTDLLRVGQQITATTYRPLEIYLAVAVIYYLLTGSLGLLGSAAERRLAYR